MMIKDVKGISMVSKLVKSSEPNRNDLCWCGSGKKYKKCHMKREKAERIKISEMIETTQKAFGQKLCLHPRVSKTECKGNIVKAHTVQRAVLARIAEDGHVYGFLPDASVFKSMGSKEQVLAPSKIGINTASTFTGFCAKHDNETFCPIEAGDFICCAEHAFLLGYRALCRELFAKKAALDFSGLFRNIDSGQPLPVQVAIQRFAHPFIEGTKAGHSALVTIKTDYDVILERKDFGSVKYYAILFDHYPDILCSGGFWPEFDFSCKKVQNLLTPNPESMQFSLITMEKGGLAVFTWLEKKGVCEQFINSLHTMSDTDLSHALVRFTFEYFENTYFKTSWWENLTEDQRIKLHERMAMVNSITMEHQTDCLIDDHLRVVNWKILERRTNVSL